MINPNKNRAYQKFLRSTACYRSKPIEQEKRGLTEKEKEEWNTNIEYLEALGSEFEKKVNLKKYKK